MKKQLSFVQILLLSAMIIFNQTAQKLLSIHHARHREGAIVELKLAQMRGNWVEGDMVTLVPKTIPVVIFRLPEIPISYQSLVDGVGDTFKIA